VEDEAGNTQAPAERPLVSMLIRHAGQQWHVPKVGQYPDEAALQLLLAESPELLGSADRRAVVRELEVPGIGSLDICAVGPSGTITLVECKLHKNPEIRRKVVGQLFAYAAGLWGISYEEFDGLWAKTREAASRPLASMVELVVDGGDSWDQEEFRASVSENLRAGRFDLIFAVDSLTEELKQVARYLNEHTLDDLRILGVELGYARDDDVEVLVPSVYGHESADRPRSTPWDMNGLRAVLSTQWSKTGLQVLDQLVSHVDAHGVFSWGRNPKSPTVSGRYRIGSEDCSVWTLWTGPPRMSINWASMTTRAVPVPQERLNHFVERLGQEVPALKEPLAHINWLGATTIPAEKLSHPGVAEGFLRAVDALISTEREFSAPLS
jgi:hypothetical protein